MNITPTNSNVNFQKQLKAECAVLNKNGHSEPCKIYKLETEKDRKYFFDLCKKREWENARFLEYAMFQLPREEQCKSNTYVLENKNNECLAFCGTTKTDGDYLEVLEVNPKYRNEGWKNKKSDYKYLGETLLTFIVKQAKKNSVKNVFLTTTEDSRSFYKKHGFKEKFGKTMFLNNKDYDFLIDINENHTGEKINLLI